MKTTIVSLIISITALTMVFANEREKINTNNQMSIKTDSLLRHVVLLKFKKGTTPEHIEKVEAAFSDLPSKISEIQGYEWGLNNSPEGLDKGFTHCFFLTFKSEADRAAYLPHPDHKAFGAVLTPYLEDVLVIDYWAPSK